MPTPIDELSIEIDAKAQNANSAIDSLCRKLDRLATSLSTVDSSKLNGLANSIQRLGAAMQTMNTVKTADFTRLATNLSRLGAVNVSALNSAASSMSHLTRAFNSLGTVSANAVAVGDLAKNIAKLGNKSVQTAIANIPQLAKALKGLMTTLAGAPKVSQSVIQMTNALANLTAQGSKVGSASNSIVKGFNRTSSGATRTKKSFKGLASAFGRFYANCFLVIRGVKALWKSISSTADYLEAFNYFEVALDKVGNDWKNQFSEYGYESAEEYANSFKTRLSKSLSGLSGVQISVDSSGETGLLTDTGLKNLGLNIQEVTQYASQLASVTNSVGQTGETTLATASAFTKLGADMSSLFNVNYSDVMKNLQSGLIGQSRALYKYGIDITNATLQTYAYKLGVSKAVSEMTQAEKMQLRMIAILDQSKVSWGDLANTINSPSNMLRQFKNNLKEAGMILGQLFVPLLQKVLPIINGVTIAIKRMFVSLASIMGIKLDLSSFGQGTSDVADEMDSLSDSYDNATESANKLKKAVYGFDEINANTSKDSSSTGTTSTGSSVDLTKDILKATEEYESAWSKAFSKMQNEADKFADKFSKAMQPVKKIIQDFAVGDYFQAGQDVSNLVVGINNFVANAIDKVDWHGIGTKVGDFVAGINWLDVLGSIGNLVWQAIKASIEQYSGMFDAAPVETTIITAVALLKFTGLGKIVWGKITKEILKHLNFTTIGQAFVAGVKGLFGSKAATSALAFMDKLAVGFTGITSFIGGAVLAVGNFFSMWKNGFNWLKEILMVLGTAIAAVGAVILGIATGPVAAVVAAVAAAVGTVTVLLHDNWNAVCKWFSGAGEWFSTNVIEPVASFFEDLWKKVSVFFKKLWDDIKSVWIGASTWFNAYVIEPIVSFFTGLAKRVGQIFEGLFILVRAVWKVASTWFNDSVIHPIKNGFDWLWDGIKAIWSTVPEWFDAYVITPISNVFSKIWGVVSGVFSTAWNEAKKIWMNASGWFGENVISPVSNAFRVACDTIGGFFGSLWNGVKNGVAMAMNAVIGTIEKAINFLVNGVNAIITGFNKVVKWGAGVVGEDWGGVDLIPKAKLPKVPAFAVGGFPEDGLFFANHTEMVGQFSNGKTAVANNEQITEGIRRAVVDGMMEVFMATSGDGGDGQTIEIPLYIGNEQIAKATSKGISSLKRRGVILPEFA